MLPERVPMRDPGVIVPIYAVKKCVIFSTRVRVRTWMPA
jgi:hypothetical protein